MDLIAAAGRMGMDVFTIDDGWQTDYGDNAINLKLFPNGLDEIQAAVEQAGMRLGLWVATRRHQHEYRGLSRTPRVGLHGPQRQAQVHRHHGGLAGRDVPRHSLPGGGCEADQRFDWPLSSWRTSRWTLPRCLTLTANRPAATPKAMTIATWAESLVRIYEGIQYVTDHIYRDHPDVLLDLTFELWGQKHIIDYGLLAAGDLDWLSNVDDGRPGSAGPRQARTLLYLRSLAIPSETMLIGNLQAEMAPIEERLATAMGSGPLFLGDLRKLTPEQQAWYGEKIRWFKALRKDVPLLDGFFPLGNWQQPGAATWDGFARLSRQGEGMIALFKNESHLDHVTVKLPVFPDGTFHVRSAMTGHVTWARPPVSSSARESRFNFRSTLTVEILEIRK